jgi:hypothetical protein
VDASVDGLWPPVVLSLTWNWSAAGAVGDWPWAVDAAKAKNRRAKARNRRVKLVETGSWWRIVQVLQRSTA